MKKLAIILIILVLFALGAFLARDSAQQFLADVTGEELLNDQLKGLGYLAISYTQPAHDTADFTPMKYADVNPFGINTFFDQEVEEAKVRQSLQMIRDAGIHWIRQEFPWEDIEQPGKGQYWDTKHNYSNWIKYDRLVNLAQEYGIEIVARLDHPPAWTRKDGRARGDFAPPDNYDDYGDFVATVVDRYRGRIKFYQLWNEPNIYPEWGELPIDPEGYTRLLKIGYTRAKATDPNVVIIAAGLAQTAAQHDKALNELLFLERMYEAGARGYFDIMGAQDYGLFTGPGDRRVEFDRTNFSRPILLRELMVKYGDADKPIWATEVGWNAAPPGIPAIYGRVTENQQAQNTVRGYERAANEWTWMGMMSYWFLRRVNESEKNQPFYYFRMLEPDFKPLPVYGAMKDYIASARYVAPGFRSTSHWAMEWSGGWETVGDDRAYFGEYKSGRQGDKETGKQGDKVSFAFRGTDLDLVVMQNPYGGAVRVQIDNNAPREIELWRTDSGAGGRIALARDLDNGEHRVTITVTRAPVAINGFVVQSGNGGLVRRVGLLGSLLVCCVAGWFVVGRGRARINAEKSKT